MTRSILPIVLSVVVTLLGAGFAENEVGVAYAQVAPITPSGLNTQVSDPFAIGGQTQYDITGGTRPGGTGGTNLYHSFGDFNVPTNNIANFLNDTGLPTSNILGRVTGGNVSNIFGTIQTIGFGDANLFLMNPAGFLFGPNATVNVGGMVAFTTADYLRLEESGAGNAGIFHADSTQASILTSAPVAAFGFLGSNTGAITVQGSQLTVTEGSGISLVGGNITIQSGTLEDATVQPARLSAPGGQINLASVVSPGEMPTADFLPALGMTRGDTTLTEGAMLNVSANTAGTVRIRSGSFVMDNAVISADTINANGALIAIDINVTDNVSISTTDVPALTARTTGTGNAGEITISSGSMDVTATTVDSFSFSAIDTHTSSSGNAGNVAINTGDLTVAGDPFSGGTLFIESGTSGMNPGRGGDVTISSGSIELFNTLISTGNLSAFFLDEGGAGTAGNVTITADSLQMTLSQIVTDSFDFAEEIGQAGDITVTAHDINLDNSAFSSAGQEGGGAITINTDHLFAVDSQIVAQTNLTPGGAVTVTGKVIELTTGSSIVSSTGGDGDAGSILITATDRLELLQATPLDRPSGIFSNSDGIFGSLGNSGDIVITTPRLEMTGGARINTSTATSGRGGNVTINTTNSISMSGETGGQFPEPLFSLGTIRPSGIFTLTIGGNCTGPCGNAGNVSISTRSLTMGTGSQIDSGTNSSGRAGDIAITATDTISMSGTLSTGQPGGIQSRTIGTEPGAGSGGNISLTAGQSVTISNGASVSASSTGPGDAGNIAINAGQQFDMRNSSVKTEAPQAGGGNIDIQAVDRVRLVNSTVSTSVLGGAGSGGNITIDPNIVVLQNSQVIAQAVQGSGGNITITTPLFLADQTSLVSASSQFGLNGTVTIQSPTSNISESLGALASEPSQAQSLLTQRCAAMANGQASSFVVAGREQLPADPGSWLTSPLAFAALGESLGAGDAVASVPAVMAVAAQDSGMVSLRRLTPAGFLIANFADSEATGCHS